MASIRERIIRQAVRIVETIPSVETVYRWDSATERTYANHDAIVRAGEEVTKDWAHGNPSTIHCSLELIVGVVLFPTETDTASTDERVASFAGLLRDAFNTNRTFREDATHVDLAVDSEVSSVDAPELVDGASVAAVRVMVNYLHDGDNVSRFGSVIPEA